VQREEEDPQVHHLQKEGRLQEHHPTHKVEGMQQQQQQLQQHNTTPMQNNQVVNPHSVVVLKKDGQ